MGGLRIRRVARKTEEAEKWRKKAPDRAKWKEIIAGAG